MRACKFKPWQRALQDFSSHAADYVIDGDGADGMFGAVYYR